LNKKDCENIGYILAAAKAPPHIVEKFAGLDPRIQPEYEGYAGVEARHAAVDERYNEIMTAKFGGNWCLLRDKSGFKGMREQAMREIYGDDYHPSLLR